jgi:hypothetical protein
MFLPHGKIHGLSLAYKLHFKVLYIADFSAGDEVVFSTENLFCQNLLPV